MRILRMPEVKHRKGNASHATVYGEIHAGLFTQPVRIGQRAVGWPSNEVDAIVAARVAELSDDQIRELVSQLHDARCAGSGEPFKSKWLDRSAECKRRAAGRGARRGTKTDSQEADRDAD